MSRLMLGNVRNDNREIKIMSEEYLRANCHALYNDVPSPDYVARQLMGVSRYTVLPGIVPHNIMTREFGWVPVAYRAIATVNPALARFQPYEITYVPPQIRFAIDEPLPMIVIGNSYNGVKVYSNGAGIYDPRCLNGMLARLVSMPTLETKHDGAMDTQAIYANLRRIVMGVDTVHDTLRLFRSIQIGQADQMALAHMAVNAIIPQHRDKVSLSDILSPLYRYQSDDSDGTVDAYRLWARLQSRLVQQGDITIRTEKRRTTYKGVNNVLEVGKANMTVFGIIADYVQTVRYSANRLFAESHGLPAPTSTSGSDIMVF